MKVIIPILRALSTPHYETDLEIAQRHLDRGDDVHLLTCKSSIPTCDYVLEHDAGSCLRCIERRSDGINKLSPSPTTHGILNLTSEDERILRGLPESFDSQQALRQFSIKGFDVGTAVLSTLISQTRKLNIDVAEKRSRLIQDMVHTGVAIYLSTQNHLEELAPDRVYIFNGRFNTVRAVLRACQKRGIDCHVHDRGHDLNHFETYENTLPHDLDYILSEINHYWKEADSEQRVDEAEQFYQQRAEGHIPNWESFTADQKEGALPSSFVEKIHNVAVYPSSEDEFVAIGEEWDNPIYRDQRAGLNRIAADLESESDVHLYVRVHPNLASVDNEQTRELNELDDRDGVTVIPANSSISSYALLRASDCVLTFGSTMGIEATYWRKPSVLAGTCFYRDLGATYIPESHRQVIRFLKDSSLSPKPVEPSLKYGHYQATKGKPFKYFEPTDLFDGEFKGEKVAHKDGMVHKVGERLTRSGKMQPVWKLISAFTYRRSAKNVHAS